jgi:hypothetical protein
MHPLLASVPTLAVATIYCLYNFYRQDRQRREERLHRLRRRVAYLLWVMVNDSATMPTRVCRALPRRLSARITP